LKTKDLKIGVLLETLIREIKRSLTGLEKEFLSHELEFLKSLGDLNIRTCRSTYILSRLTKTWSKKN